MIWDTAVWTTSTILGIAKNIRFTGLNLKHKQTFVVNGIAAMTYFMYRRNNLLYFAFITLIGIQIFRWIWQSLYAPCWFRFYYHNSESSILTKLICLNFHFLIILLNAYARIRICYTFKYANRNIKEPGRKRILIILKMVIQYLLCVFYFLLDKYLKRIMIFMNIFVIFHHSTF